VTLLNFILLVELVLLACMVLGMALAWIIYRQYPDEPFNVFFRLFWRQFFSLRVHDASADPRAIRSSTRAIALVGASDDESAVDGLMRHGVGDNDEDDEEAGVKARSSGGGGNAAGVATLEVKVVPSSSRDQIAGRYAEGIKVNVTAAPEDGDANRAVIQLLADALDVKVYQIQLIRGHYRPQKTVKIAGISQAALDRKIASFA
jgi:uncharacterized protein (TIGR00251 family)